MRILNNFFLLLLIGWFILEVSEVISVLETPFRYPFGHEGLSWRYQSENTYLAAVLIESILALAGILVGPISNQKLKLVIRSAIVAIIALSIFEATVTPFIGY